MSGVLFGPVSVESDVLFHVAIPVAVLYFEIEMELISRTVHLKPTDWDWMNKFDSVVQWNTVKW